MRFLIFFGMVLCICTACGGGIVKVPSPMCFVEEQDLESLDDVNKVYVSNVTAGRGGDELVEFRLYHNNQIMAKAFATHPSRHGESMYVQAVTGGCVGISHVSFSPDTTLTISLEKKTQNGDHDWVKFQCQPEFTPVMTDFGDHFTCTPKAPTKP